METKKEKIYKYTVVLYKGIMYGDIMFGYTEYKPMCEAHTNNYFKALYLKFYLKKHIKYLGYTKTKIIRNKIQIYPIEKGKEYV